jgi:hypothetical protein
MEDLIVKLKKRRLDTIAVEVHDAEIACSLKAIEVDGDGNFAIYARDGSNPEGEIIILPSPAVPPAGATKICDGHLKIAGVVMPVTVFRKAA